MSLDAAAAKNVMRVAIFGADGPTGRLLARDILDAGHVAIAITRHPDDYPVIRADLAVVGADATCATGRLGVEPDRADDGAPSACGHYHRKVAAVATSNKSQGIPATIWRKAIKPRLSKRTPTS